MHKTTQISLICAALLGGVVLGRSGLSADYFVVAVAGTAALLAWRSRLFFTCLLLAVVLLGIWRTTIWSADRDYLASFIGQEVTVTGFVVDDPTRSPTGQVSFNVGNLKQADQATLPGQLKVYLYPVQVQRGYQVQATGKVKPGFGNSVAELSYPKFKVISTHQDWLERLRQRFFAGVKTALPEPIASFGLGLLVGIRALIPKEMQTELTLVGLSHLVAVSGYNLTIIVQAVDRSLKRLGRGVALATSLWLIAGFLIVTGASASIVRASLVSVLSLLAAFYGRRFQPTALILLAASTTAIWEPKYLTDLGWLLSFLAFYGILVLAPAVEARLGNPKPVLIRLFVESFAAQVLTTPLILFFFGQLSIVAPLTNLIILPLIPIAMAVSFVAGLAGMFIPAFAGWLAWPAMLVLGFITKLIDGFAALPWAGREDQITLTMMLLMYALVIGITLTLQRINRRRGLKSTHSRVTEIVAHN